MRFIYEKLSYPFVWMQAGLFYFKIKKLDEKWGQKHDRLAYYIEHDELEKVDTAIVSLKSFIETDDYSSAIAELDKGKFILEHIQKKYAFNLENIF